MTTSPNLLVGGTASLLSIATATGGVLPGIGSLSTASASGQVLQVSGVSPLSAHPSAVARAQSIAAAQVRDQVREHTATCTEKCTAAHTAPPTAAHTATRAMMR
jgi:hypothetical protein